MSLSNIFVFGMFGISVSIAVGAALTFIRTRDPFMATASMFVFGLSVGIGFFWWEILK